MTRSAETKESTINSWRKNVETDREKRLENAVQKATKNLFSHLSDKEQNDIIKQINEYLKTPDSIKPRELFQKLIEIKNNNPNNPKLAQIIINHIKKLNEKNTLDIKNKKLKRAILSWKNRTDGSSINDIKNKIPRIKESLANKNKPIQEKMEKVLKAQSLLKPEYQPTQAQITAKIQSLSPETKTKLKSSGLSETDYAKLLASKDSLFSAGDTSQESRDFLDSLKELNQSLGIRDLDQMPNSFSVDKQFFKDNPDLVKHIWESPDFKTLDNSFDLSWLKNFKEVATFVEKFGDENLKRLKSQISPFFDEEWRLKQLTPEERKIFETFFSSFQAIKQQMTWVSTNMLKAWAMQAPIVALYQYLDEPSLWLENLNQQNRKIWDTKN